MNFGHHCCDYLTIVAVLYLSIVALWLLEPTLETFIYALLALNLKCCFQLTVADLISRLLTPEASNVVVARLQMVSRERETDRRTDSR